MEYVVAIKIRDRGRGEFALLTWGRVHDSVDDRALAAAVRRVIPSLGFNDVETVTVCAELADVREYRYFYEGMIHFTVKMAVEPYNDEDWAAGQRSDDRLIRNIYLLGSVRAV